MSSNTPSPVRSMPTAEDNIGLVYKVVSLYVEQYGRQRIGADWVADLVQEGYLGRARAEALFDPARGRFSTYAWWWISRYVRNELSRFRREEVRNLSLDKPEFGDDEDSVTIGDRFVDENMETAADAVDRMTRREWVRNHVADLPERERLIVEYVYGVNGREQLTQTEVAQRMHVSVQRVHVILARALNRLRAAA